MRINQSVSTWQSLRGGSPLIHKAGWLILVFLGCGLIAHGQTTIKLHAGDPLYFEQDAPDLATANAKTYHLQSNGVQVSPSLPNVSCGSVAGLATTFTCKALVPDNITLGAATLTITSVGPNQSESAPSNPLNVTIELPQSSQPRNLRATPQ